MSHGLLSLAVGSARESVWVYLDEGERAGQGRSSARGETAGKRCLASAWRADKQDNAVHRQVHLLKQRSGCEVQNGLRQQAIL
jgi:hypothetical protein